MRPKTFFVLPSPLNWSNFLWMYKNFYLNLCKIHKGGNLRLPIIKKKRFWQPFFITVMKVPPFPLVHRPGLSTDHPLVGSDLLVGNVHFSMRRRRKFSACPLTTPLVGNDLLPVGGQGGGYIFLFKGTPPRTRTVLSFFFCTKPSLGGCKGSAVPHRVRSAYPPCMHCVRTARTV
jgi:hypothetical protein